MLETKAGESLVVGAEMDSLRADLVELERKLIPLLNRVRALLGKPPVVTQERPLDARREPP